MVERSTPWPTGTPIWVDLAAADPVAATRFYGDLFGWEFEHQGRHSRNYWVCRLDGEDVCGIGPKQPGTEQLPSRWTTYFSTDHLDLTLDAIAKAGGKPLLPPREVPPYGRMAIAADPTGAVFGLWQAADHIGTTRRTAPGMLVWSEALSRDYETSKAFYSAVFGYRHEEIGGTSTPYAALYLDDRAVAGTGDIHRDLPPGSKSQWLPYFATAGLDETVAQVVRTGGRLLSGPLTTDFGRLAVLADPEDAAFAVVQLT